MNSFRRLPHWIGIASVLVIALVAMGLFIQHELTLTGGELGVPLDDAWIHYQFARNLSSGSGFSYNPGEPTPGSTSPLWTMLLAGVGLFTTDFLIPSLLLSAFFFLATIGLTYGFTVFLTESRGAALFAALGVALSGRLLWASLAGMETTAFAALSIAALWWSGRRGFGPAGAFLFGLASQMRPEGHALFAIVAADALLHLLRSKPTSSTLLAALRPLALSGLVYGAISAPYVLFSLASTGHPLPNTFYAKAGSEHLFSLRTLRETLRLHWLDNPASLLLIPFGLAAVWRRNRVTVVWLLGLPLLTAVIVDFIWHHGRYTMPLIPFQMIAAAAGALWLAQKLSATKIMNQQSRWPTFISALLLALFVLAGAWGLPRWADMLGSNTREIQDIDVALGLWLADNTPADALIAVDDIGAVTFLSQRRIVDMNGLVSPEMWPAMRAPVGLPRNRLAARILSQSSPDYMVGFPLWHWEITSDPDVAVPIHTVETATRTIIGEQQAVVYRTTWPYVAQANPDVAVDASLGDAIALLGYDLTLPAAAGESLALRLYWQSMAPVEADYDVFVHVLNEAGELVAQADQKPVHGLAATPSWEPGDKIRDPYHLVLPADLPPGPYTISVGMYLRENGARLPVNDPKAVDNAILLSTFEWGG